MSSRKSSVHINQIYSPAYLQGVIRHTCSAGGTHLNHDDPTGMDASAYLLFMEQEKVAVKLARAIRHHRFSLSAATARSAMIDGKSRILYRQIPVDLVVTRAVTGILSALSPPHYSNALYSYQKGTGAIPAITALRDYFRAHLHNCPDQMQRGLYVLKRDISSYGEAIPIHEASGLWPILKEVTIQPFHADEQHPFWRLLVECIRREVTATDGERRVLGSGTPTGSPIQPIINNLYLGPLDRMLAGIPGGFYARYGDDFVFAHPDADAARRAEADMDQLLARLELRVRDAKRKNVYLTIPGKSSARWPETLGATGLEFLGCTIAFRGVVSLKKAKARMFLRHVRKRIETVANMVDAPISEKGRAICSAVNAALDPQSLLAERYAHLLRYIVDDRRQLAHLDYLLAKMVACTLTRNPSVRAFRKVSYRHIREEFGLHSLVVLKNMQGKKSRGGQ